jgi:trigger factor
VREKIFTEAAGLVSIEIPDTLVNQEMERRLHDLAHRLEEQMKGLTIPQYLAMTGQDQQEFVDGLREGAHEAVRADLALRAVIVQESIEATEDELTIEIERVAERFDEKPAQVRKDLERRGVLEAVRSDIARSKALQFLVDHAEVVDEAGNPVDLTLPQPNDAEPDDAEIDPPAGEPVDAAEAAPAAAAEPEEEPKS